LFEKPKIYHSLFLQKQSGRQDNYSARLQLPSDLLGRALSAYPSNLLKTDKGFSFEDNLTRDQLVAFYLEK